MYERAQVIEKKGDTKKGSSAPKAQHTEFSPSTSSAADRILSLQRSVGNQAVQRLFKGVGDRRSAIGGQIQPKLTIGQPGDIYEQEADRVAEQVMRMPEPRVQRQVEPENEEEERLQTKPLANEITPLVQVQRQEEPEEEVETLQAKPLAEQITPLVQRQVEEEEEDALLQPKLETNAEHPIQRQVEEEEEEEEPIQMKQADVKTSQVGSTRLEAQIHSLRGGGKPLPRPVRDFFEPRFGHDFSHVRLHTDSKAVEAARSVNAKAFTIGKDVVFGAGEYSPETLGGRQLLAHELTHVIQQQSRPLGLQRQTDSIVECTRSGAQACLVHLHRSERRALEAARRLYSQYCVNLVYIQTPPNTRLISVDVPASGGLTCRADPNRVFSEAGIRAGWNGWNNRRCRSRRFRDRAISAVVDFGNELRRIIESCHGSVGAQGSGQRRLPVFALHNYRDRSGSVLQRFIRGGAYNTRGNRATALPDRPEDMERLLRIFRRLANYSFPILPSGCPQRADVTPSRACLENLNPYFAQGEESDFYLVTREEDFVEFAQQRRNVVLQATNPSDDGSLSVVFAQQGYINLETWHGRDLDENVRQAEAALRHLGVSRGCSQSPAVCNTVTPSLPSSPSAPASSPAAEEIRRTPHKQENRFLINNTQGILADLKKNLVIQRRILIGRRPEITEEERERRQHVTDVEDEITEEEERERRHEITVEERNLLHRPRTLVAYIIYRHRDLADRIIEDMEESGEDLYFRDLDELRREIATRIETSTAMQATQEGPGSRAFAYPRRGRDNYYGPRVNIAARDYWEPSVPDNYRVRRPAEAMHPRDPDQVQGPTYHFTLTTPIGRENGYQALMSLFEPQSHWRHRTLIHCDRFANLIHFRSFAVTLGSGEFNRRVREGIIPLVLRHNGYFGIRYSDVARTGGPAIQVHLRVVHPENRGDLLIGDHVVFHNHHYYDSLMEIAGRTGVWRLEHAILIDRQGSDPERDDIFLGHGSGRRNEQGMKRVLRTHFNNMVGHARGMLLRDYNRVESRFSGRLTRSGREFYIGRWQIHEITENDVPGLYDPRTYPRGSLFQVHRPAESRRD